MKDSKEIIDQLDYLFTTLRNRWKSGLTQFKTRIDLFRDEKYRALIKDHDIINTPIHNIITIENRYLFILLDSIFMQRLRGINHQGFAYLVYPTARHSRFEHSLGVYKLTKDIIKSMKKRREYTNFENCEYSETDFLVAALLHDIGHYPFSHIGENIFNDFITKIKFNIKNLTQLIPDHEKRSADLIGGGDILKEIIKYSNEENNIEFDFNVLFDEMNKISENHIDINNVRCLIRGKKLDDEKQDQPHLINGPLDTDKLDYILREAYFTGTPFGNIDIHRIKKGYAIRQVRLDGKIIKNQLAFNKRMLNSVMQMYVGRELNFNIISFHRTLRIAETTVKAILDIGMENLLKILSDNEKEDYIKKVLIHFKLMEDRDFLSFLEILAQLSKRALILLNRLLTRDLHKRSEYIESLSVSDLNNREVLSENNMKIQLYFPTNFMDLLEDDTYANSYPIFRNEWKKLNQRQKDMMKDFSEIINELENDVILLNAFNYPLSLDKISKQIKENKFRNIFIFEDKNESALPLPEINDKINDFIATIHNQNSNIIFAFDRSVIDKIKKSKLFNNKDFIENLILLVLAYNNVL